jgi:hypothetical protein
LRLSNADTSIEDNDVLGSIQFASKSDGSGGEALEPSACIWAEAEGTYTSSGNETALVFATATSTTALQTANERMRINKDGNVGIGTAVPNKQLSVNAAGGGQVAINREDADNAITAGNEIGRISFGGDDPTDDSFQVGAIVMAVADDDWASTDCPTKLEFYTCDDGTNTLDARMTIKNDGNIGIGTATPTSTLHVSRELIDDATLAHFEYHTADNAVDANDTIMVLEFGDDNSEAGTPYFIRFQDSDSVMAHIKWDDDNSAVFTDVSDYRIKSNIEPMSGSLVDLNKLKPSSFNIREASKKAYGFIAHELAEVYPSMVTGEKDAVDEDGKILPQSIAQSKLIPFMIKAIQELSAKVTALENA